MDNLILDIIGFFIGLLLGFFFYGGLYLTLQRLPTTSNPALLAIGSFLLRSLVVVGVLYLVMDHHPERIVAATIGFLVAMVISRVLSSRHASERGSTKPGNEVK